MIRINQKESRHLLKKKKKKIEIKFNFFLIKNYFFYFFFFFLARYASIERSKISQIFVLLRGEQIIVL